MRYFPIGSFRQELCRGHIPDEKEPLQPGCTRCLPTVEGRGERTVVNALRVVVSTEGVGNPGDVDGSCYENPHVSVKICIANLSSTAISHGDTPRITEDPQDCEKISPKSKSSLLGMCRELQWNEVVIFTAFSVVFFNVLGENYKGSARLSWG